MTTVTYTLYFNETGRVHCICECDVADRPAAGQAPGLEGLSVAHGIVDARTEMVVDGVVLPLPDEMVEQERERDNWFEFRKKRFRFLEATDKQMIVSDFPTDARETERLRRIRQQLRDIPETAANAKEALSAFQDLTEPSPRKSGGPK